MDERENPSDEMEASAEMAAGRERVFAALHNIPDECLTRPASLGDFLIVLMERLREAGVLTCYVAAAGGGDEGEIESPEFTFKEGVDASDAFVDQLSDDLDEFWQPLFDRYPFDWQEAEGGELTLHVDTVTGECDWTASAPVMTVLDGHSSLLTVKDGKLVEEPDEEERQRDDAMASCDE